MTVETTKAKEIASGNGVATVFSFSPIVIFDTTDLEVTKTDTSGIETLLVEGTGETNYSVSAASGSFPSATGVTGSITYPATGVTNILQTGEKITIRRVLPLLQQTDLENQGGYFADIQEAQFDKVVMQNIQQQEELDRVVKAPVSDDVVDLTLPTITQRASRIFGWTATGSPQAVELASSTIAVTPFVATLVDDEDATEFMTTLGFSTYFQTLVDAADAATTRTTLGLGTLSTVNSVATSNIDNNAVTLDKLEDGTQGDVLYYAAAGAPTRLAAGTSGHVLTTQGVGADPQWQAAPGAWTYQTEVDLSAGSPSAINFDVATAVSNGATEIVIAILAASASAANTLMSLQLGDTDGLEATGYNGAVHTSQTNSSQQWSTSALLTNTTQFDAVDTIYGEIRFNLYNAGTNTWMINSEFSHSNIVAGFFCNGSKSLTAALEDINLQVSTGNFDSGTAVLRYR